MSGNKKIWDSALKSHFCPIVVRSLFSTFCFHTFSLKLQFCLFSPCLSGLPLVLILTDFHCILWGIIRMIYLLPLPWLTQPSWGERLFYILGIGKLNGEPLLQCSQYGRAFYSVLLAQVTSIECKLGGPWEGAWHKLFTAATPILRRAPATHFRCLMLKKMTWLPQKSLSCWQDKM